MDKSNKDQFEVLVRINKDVNSWFWEKRVGSYVEYCANNHLSIIRHKNGYLCSTTWNKKIGTIVDIIMRMYEKEYSTRFPGKITIMPTDYYVLNKSDPHAVTAYVIIEM